ncbi:MAG: hypothetical protein CMI16_07295 [Opitutaceae bacterium]|nr:hypothetical protein [Opitutaceae bacterium]|tara:strand:- start:65 stop:292 length:228 start_codon:yes stop_codon:yes gene_type:complete
MTKAALRTHNAASKGNARPNAAQRGAICKSGTRTLTPNGVSPGTSHHALVLRNPARNPVAKQRNQIAWSRRWGVA